MAEITPLVNSYCQHFKQKEQLRKQTSEVSKDLKDAHDRLLEQMSIADLRIIRSLSAGYDIKLYQKIKKPGSSVKNLRKTLEKHELPIETIDSIMSDIKTGKEETAQVIKLIPLNKESKNKEAVISA